MRSLFDLLKKPRPAAAPVAPAANVSLVAVSGAEHAPQPGLIRIDLTVQADRDLADARLRLRHDGEVLFEKPLALSSEPQSGWLAVHGQLLPDGLTAVSFEVVDGRGAVLAARELRLQVRNRGALARRVAESLRRSGAPAVLDGQCDSADYDYADPALTAWFDRPEPEALAHIEARRRAGEITADEAEGLRQFVRDGYLILPEVVDAAHLVRLNAALDAAVAAGHEGYQWGSSQRMHGLHEIHPAVRELWAHPSVLRMLSLIYEAPALPCQSLSYVFGSEQQHHQDTIHLTPFPAGYMNGVWTALEDVQPDSGELVVYPGTHRLPRVYARTVGAAKVVDGDFLDLGQKVAAAWSRMLTETQAQRVVYRPKAGTVLIWHENLMHAGMVRSDKSKSRRSIVCHYFADGAVAYYDSLGVPGATHVPASSAAALEIA